MVSGYKRVSFPAALLALAVAQEAYADTSTTVVSTVGMNTYTLSSKPAATLTTPYTSVSNTTLKPYPVTPAGEIVLYEVGSGGSAPYVFTSAGAVGIPVGPTGSTYSKSAGSTMLYSTNVTAINTSGTVLGLANRTFGEANTTFNNSGTDVFLALPSTSNGTTSYTDTIVNTQGILGNVNGTGTLDGNIYYNYSAPFNGTTQQFNSATPVALNSSNQVAGTAARYTGTTSTSSLGTDAFLYTPSGTTGNGTITLLGLNETATPASIYSYNTTVTLGSASVVYSFSSSTVSAMNSAGSVVGITNRNILPTRASFAASFGNDGYLYTPASGSVQVGLIGSTPAPLGGYYSVAETYVNGSSTASGTYEYVTSVNGISAGGVVAGVSRAFSTSTYSGSGNPTVLGADAWLYTPSSTPGAATGYGTSAAGTYTQIGLTSMGGASTDPAPVIGYVTTTGARTSAISFVSTNGSVAGTSTRMFSDSTASHGNDAWYVNAATRTTTLITPTANPTFSNYVTAYVSTADAGGYSNSVVSAISANGLVGGTQGRYSTDSNASNGNPTTSYGLDAWVYYPVNNKTYVVASPAILAADSDFAAYSAYFTPTEYFTATVDSISPGGLVVGRLSAYEDPNGAILIGSYLYEWSPSTGTEIVASTSTANLVNPLTSGTFSSLVSGKLSTSLSADAAGNIYGLGTVTSSGLAGVYQLTTPALLLGDANGDGKVDLSDLNIVLNHLGSADTLRADGNFDGAATIDLTDLNDVLNNLGVSSSPSVIAAVPEPASLGIIALGTLCLLRRRRTA